MPIRLVSLQSQTIVRVWLYPGITKIGTRNIITTKYDCDLALNDISNNKAAVKRIHNEILSGYQSIQLQSPGTKRLNTSPPLDVRAQISSLQEHFQAECKKQAKFGNIEQQKIAQDVATTIFDIIMQLLFDTIKLDGPNIAFPVPEANGAFHEEKTGITRKLVVSAYSVNEGIAVLFHVVERVRKDIILLKISKLYEASLANVRYSFSPLKIKDLIKIV
ncbi:MAG: hypothetical protein EZS28_053121 [Streblomastix strix]|uniref:Uncharacterized protein n=1 Tax=Streblomastix strix TaxID=222440 RepID=A0A5J4RL15_9EUKA|nr:MAG: hypothetical protein EZS28_053121 [Streblomastix strix]